MNPEELREQIESELAWRQEELSFIKNQLNYVADMKKDQFRKTLVLMLYAHFEGFSKIALQTYLQYINNMNLNICDVNSTLQAAALKREFSAYDTGDKKNEFFKKPLPNDVFLHKLSRRVELIERIEDFKRQRFFLDDDIIDTESNLRYIVLQKNLYFCGLPIDLFDEQKNYIDSLVNRRNSIAHGDCKSGVDEKEYMKWEEQTYTVMNTIVRILYEYVCKAKFIIPR
ncbi:MAG: hypothetical protein K6A38_10100 [Lachnospiraceae bacterium]|nr:hypothetical protein [Lachnospiraceae bacterium]